MYDHGWDGGREGESERWGKKGRGGAIKGEGGNVLKTSESCAAPVHMYSMPHMWMSVQYSGAPKCNESSQLISGLWLIRIGTPWAQKCVQFHPYNQDTT